jgi:signal transduction histidine kinase
MMRNHSVFGQAQLEKPSVCSPSSWRAVIRDLGKRFFSAPAFAEPERTETARWLNTFLLALTSVILIMGFAIPLIFDPHSLDFALFVADLTALLITIGCLVLMHYGYVRLAAHLVVLLLFAIVTYAITGVFDGIRSPNLLAYFVLIPLTGLLLGKQAMRRFATLCIMAVGAIYYLEAAQILTPLPRPRANWDHMLIWCLAIVFNTILLMAMLRRAEESAKAAHQAMTALVTAHAELQKSQTQLQQALAKEKELNELKSRFVSMASHEFRTPLATILLLTETLSAYRHKLTDEQIRQRLGKIQEQVGHLKEIMDDVLELARMQARRTEFKPDWLDLDAFCRLIIEEFQSGPSLTHPLLYTGAETLPPVSVDKRLLRQILSNLISNAMKYSPAEKAVTVSLTQFGETLRVQVRDEGIGIPEADLKHLFQPFHRAANVGTIAGTGLGLVITKEAVELHKGAITVESQIGVGTTFTVSLPITKQGEKEDDESASD